MEASGHSLPSADLRTEFTAFFSGARLARNGDITISFTLSPESKGTLLDLSEGDGMAMNVTIHDTKLPEGDELLAKALGLD